MENMWGKLTAAPLRPADSSIAQIACLGTNSKDYFDRHGDLKSIRRLKLTLFLCNISDWILAHI
ncbi:hypothetical protein SETIT_1G068900v2 [Setaria italica]|uniref:Uncharacterized protein n=1 Tax=Setaria italica TaxID=4555 RepID=A0A368PHV8_SETIT|nr:hypothetical protein SETIT_1G068900v2 [Setaria italica]